MLQNSNNLSQKIISNFKNLNPFSKSIIKYGLMFYLLLQIIGFSILVINLIKDNLTYNILALSTSVIKTSFTILAEIIIGGIIIDYLFKAQT